MVSVSPSYWADIPGQYKAFIDRCTPWCDTHEPHASIKEGKRDTQLLLEQNKACMSATGLFRALSISMVICILSAQVILA
ncbi:hypothetical protein [Butyrivibrio fibrisolvens]|uniref:hypothetical protein n=1 Tax=Butyrivibrio fibrisolvens TaxID=831 RepID=UPI002FE6F7D0